MGINVGDDLRECCTFLYVERSGSRVPRGTGFFLRDDDPATGQSLLYLATARHTIEWIRELDRVDSIWLRINVRDQTAGVWREIDLDSFVGHPLDNKTTGGTWLRRAAHMRQDVAVAVIPFEMILGLAMWVWPTRTGLANDEQLGSMPPVGAGDDAIIAGLFRNHLGSARNIPIVRAGIISALPGEPVETKLGPTHAFLVETHSIGGLSGSPVFWLSGGSRFDHGSKTVEHPPIFRILLLGIVHGHFELEESDTWDTPWGPERLSEGIAIATPIAKVMDVINELRDASGHAAFDTPP